MSAVVTDISIALGALWVMDKRLTYHCEEGSGRLLDGLKYDREGVLGIDGRANLPYIQPMTFSDEERYGIGAGKPIQLGTRVSFLICARREFGLFNRDPSVVPTGNEADYIGTGILDWAMRVKDAIETTVDGSNTVDCNLEGRVSKPLLGSISEAPVFGMSWNAVLSYTVDIENICRGKRSFNPAQ